MTCACIMRVRRRVRWEGLAFFLLFLLLHLELGSESTKLIVLVKCLFSDMVPYFFAHM